MPTESELAIELSATLVAAVLTVTFVTVRLNGFFDATLRNVARKVVLDASVSSAGRSGGVNATFRVAGT